jgi:hypothetical protein
MALAATLLWALMAVDSAHGAELGAALDEWSVHEGYSLNVFARGLHLPTGLALVPSPGTISSAPRLFVTELRGRIRMVANDGAISDFASVKTFEPRAEWPDFSGEGGLGGICLASDRGYVFVTYSYRDGQGILRNAMTRFSASPRTFEGPPRDRRDFRDVFVSAASAFSHQIGACTVDGDALFVNVGDGGQPARSRDLDAPLGKVLRFTLDGEPHRSNMFVSGSRVRRAVYAFGLRNTFGFVRTAGRLFAAQNGVALDSFLEIREGVDHGWDGTDSSIAMNALVVFHPSIGPAHVAHLEPRNTTIGRSTTDRFVIAASNSKQGPGLVVVDVDLGKDRVRAAPRYVVKYTGRAGGQGVTGVAASSDTIYFTPILPVGESGVILTARLEPQRAHRHVIGRTPGDPLVARPCLGCHSLGGKGGQVGPALDKNSLVTRAETAVLDPSYGELVARLNRMTDPTIVAGKQARNEVLNAPRAVKVKTWLIHRIMNPRFDSPDAQMPNLGILRPEAELIADALLEKTEGPPSRFGPLTSRRFIAGVVAGLVVGVGVMGVAGVLRGRRALGAKQASTEAASRS